MPVSIMKPHSSMNTSQIQHPNPPNSDVSIDIVELSIGNLLKNWLRRQKWHRWFFSGQVLHEARAPWRYHLAKFLESTAIHMLTILLLLVDLLFTVLDLSSSLLSCSSQKQKHDSKGYVVYHWGGIAILGLLTTKTLGLVVGLGRTFCKRPGLMVDGIVVSVALLLELLLQTAEGAGLVVVVSLWRVVRVVESAFELSDEAIEAQIAGILCQFEVLREENQQLRNVIVDRDRRIAELEGALNQG